MGAKLNGFIRQSVYHASIQMEALNLQQRNNTVCPRLSAGSKEEIVIAGAPKNESQMNAGAQKF